ncbi:MAG: bifunctional folylpolyglutamate synthase/dihydrofolate synthase [Dysgonamonadaceae bacterium]|nr:bifunctional folylpolyglutamate synthase/dihydrofolate synthase [Dysgonamonadaceae bacterium]MDD3356854.1 bifunctional folylpolyglutamate synthase/dihydrofolate synthase [Dysgonamonadaceae bacterium]MDD3728474.1 bifunctional folylpolyglutamate synthase/dihydrofolate synthase [Dysgonamonadaceae bacterium]MDD4605876.1 bifunctional folylpolyglutamate synthase/dihydrofolate synthase [Dysgonamonadaceae bacterium]HUI32831.1 folylpolyglutamate synthase/dihydrofolate synthase family protein [Dysgona
MNYQETVQYLYNQMPAYQRVGSAAYKAGLDNSLALDAYFEHPHRHYRTIHIAGTNGKGSTSHLLAAILHESGYKVGLYTSPHLIDFRERIRVNGEMINKQFVVDFVKNHRHAFEPIMPSFFELTMEMAFLYFQHMEVDVAIVETGLGGRLDSTNIISPNLSIITNIGFDHMQYLGDTLPKIAAEKAGIIKPETPVVIGEVENDEIREVFLEKATRENAPIIFAEDVMDNFSSKIAANGWILNNDSYQNLRSELGGGMQNKNARTVLASIQELLKLGYKIPNHAMYDGFANVVELTGLMGRWQTLQEKPKVVCDTGHNAHAIRYIAKQLSNEKYKTLHIIFGMANDKDSISVLSIMPKNAIYYFTQASIERALNVDILAEKADEYGLHGEKYSTVKLALEAATRNANEFDFIFIGGSSFVVADALALIQITGK